MLAYDHHQRATAKELLDLPFIKERLNGKINSDNVGVEAVTGKKELSKEELNA